jgi:hypothetical protein
VADAKLWLWLLIGYQEREQVRSVLATSTTAATTTAATTTAATTAATATDVAVAPSFILP